MFTDKHITMIRAHIELVDELHQTTTSRNQLAMIWRALLEEPHMIRRTHQVHPDTCRVSRAAWEAMSGVRPRIHSKGKKLGLRYEHPVPLTSCLYPLVRDALKRGGDVAAREVLEKFHRPSWITTEEDLRLNNCGLRSKMPSDWDGYNPFARYEEVGIELI
ncbi:MAG: hypothetical protein ABJO67_04090 [Pseudoruegeria sp.]